MTERPVALDLCSGLGGWADSLEAEGWDVIRVDITDMFAEIGVPKPPKCLLVLQDIKTFHGSQAKGCRLIVASPPCTEFSWMAMPWSRAKQVARALRNEDEFPRGYTGSRTIDDLTALFNACFRIQREACEAAGRHIPLIVENVRGAIPWVGRSRFRVGAFHFWGDVPALMPFADGRKGATGSWFGAAETRGDPREASLYSLRSDAVKMHGSGAAWFDAGFTKFSSRDVRRKAASTMIAKIPLTLATYIAHTFHPDYGQRGATRESNSYRERPTVQPMDGQT